jgi:Fic family protein
MLKTARSNSLDFIGKHLLDIASRLHGKFYSLVRPDYAGVYRDCGIGIRGSDRIFPGPEAVGDHMHRFRELFMEYKEEFHPVVLAAFAHLQLVLIHPYADGNGRTSRLLMNLVLVNQGYQIINFEPQTRNRYYSALKKSDREGSGHSEFFTLLAELELEDQDLYMKMIAFKPGGNATQAPGRGNPGQGPQ